MSRCFRPQFVVKESESESKRQTHTGKDATSDSFSPTIRTYHYYTHCKPTSLRPSFHNTSLFLCAPFGYHILFQIHWDSTHRTTASPCLLYLSFPAHIDHFHRPPWRPQNPPMSRKPIPTPATHVQWHSATAMLSALICGATGTDTTSSDA